MNKVYCLYYNDQFIVAFPNREDTVEFGKTHYFGKEWDCKIEPKYLNDYQLNKLTIDRMKNDKNNDIKPYEPPYTWTCSDGPKPFDRY
jgi:hypothetical protein